MCISEKQNLHRRRSFTPPAPYALAPTPTEGDVCPYYHFITEETSIKNKICRNFDFISHAAEFIVATLITLSFYNLMVHKK